MKKIKLFNVFSVLVFQLVGSLVAGLVASFAFVKPAIEEKAENYELVNQYTEVPYDYKIIHPSEEQISTFAEDNSSQAVFKFYSVTFDYVSEKTDIQISVYSVDEMASIKYTEFNDLRIFKKTDDYLEKGVYIDYSFARENNLKLGDKISFGNLSFEITALLKKCQHSMAFSPELLSLSDSIGNIPYQGVYVVCNNKNQFKEKFLNNYIPYGEMRDRESFKSEEEYESYASTFFSKDYSSFVLDKDLNKESDLEKFESSTSFSNKMYLIASILVCVLSFVVVVSSLFITKKAIYEENRVGNISSLIKTHSFSPICSMILFLSLTFFSSISIINSLVFPFKFNAVALKTVILCFSSFFGLLAGYFINYFFIKKISKRNFKEQSCKNYTNDEI